MLSKQALLEIKGLSVDFTREPAAPPAVDEVSFELITGECFGIVGESGSGKSTLCRAISGLLPSSAAITGTAHFDGNDLLSLDRPALDRVRSRQLAMIFQEPASFLNPIYRIGWQLSESIKRRSALPDGPDSKDANSASLAAQLLRNVGITDSDRVLQSYPHELSGGMCQRVMIAMAIARTPQLLLADEPTTALDVTIQAQILDLLRRLIDDTGLTVLLVSHDLGVVAELCDRVGVMNAGRLVEVGAVEQVFTKPRHPYSAALLAAAPKLDGQVSDLGITPTPNDRRSPALSGCSYRSKCGRAVPDCTVTRPEMARGGIDSAVACHSPLPNP